MTTQSQPARSSRHAWGVAGSCEAPAQAVPSSMLAQETIEAFAAAIGAIRGEPCVQCGCALYRNMTEYRVCIQSYLPRGYHVYSVNHLIPWLTRDFRDSEPGGRNTQKWKSPVKASSYILASHVCQRFHIHCR